MIFFRFICKTQLKHFKTCQIESKILLINAKTCQIESKILLTKKKAKVADGIK